MKWGLPISINILFWSSIGLLRYADERRKKKLATPPLSPKRLAKLTKQVAVCLPAHNEELVLRNTINSLQHFVRSYQIFVVSDGSIDRTAAIARAAGCQVLELNPGRGKAAALEALVSRFKIYQHYRYIIFADADCRFTKGYLKYAIPIFHHDPTIVAIAGHTATPWPKHVPLTIASYLLAYRTRLYRILQWLLTFGWTWRYTNVTSVIPGFASIYRTDILRQLKIYVPGLLIEDFSLAFQIHRQKLGRIAYHPAVGAIDQDPDNLGDYWRQVRRWNVGFWQTVRHWGFWPSLFWAALGAFAIEIILAAFFFLLLPVIIPVLIILSATTTAPPVSSLAGIPLDQYQLALIGIFVGVFLIDYLMTLVVAWVDRRDQLAIFGLAFLPLRMLDSLILLISTPQGLFTKSDGRWRPPTRRAWQQNPN